MHLHTTHRVHTRVGRRNLPRTTRHTQALLHAPRHAAHTGVSSGSASSTPQASAHRRSTRRQLAPAAVPEAQAASRPADTAAVWAQFAQHASGEWEGVTTTFAPDGTPKLLPEHFVPEAYREWGVDLWDWQSQCSCTADPTLPQQYRSVVRRLMPTVGCEADAVAFTEEDAGSSSSSSSSNGSSAGGGAPGAAAGAAAAELTAAADGSYNWGPAAAPPAGPDTDPPGPSKFQVEHCFVLPRASHPDSSSGTSGSGSGSSTPSSAGAPVRVKVVQQFRRDWSNGHWTLAGVDLHRERFDGPYTGKRELAGCGGGQPGIAQLQALQQQQLAGAWHAAAAAAGASSSSSSSGGGGGGHGSCLSSTGAAPLGTQVTLLPLGAWSAVQLGDDGQLQRAEAGLLLPDHAPAQRAVSVRVYADGQLAGSSLGVEVQG